MSKKNIALLILEHPDKDELITKLLSSIPVAEIHEWLESRYTSVGEKKFVLSDKVISTFQKEYLDIYSIIKDDIAKTRSNKLTAEEELKQEIQGNPLYHSSLERIVKIEEKGATTELDIKTIAKKLVVNIEFRAAQIFDQIQEDPRNIKPDRVLIEWLNLLTTTLEKYDMILNGNPDQINIQNNINIQVVDEHINVVYNIIKEILSKLDYDTSLLFIEMFNDAMKNLKDNQKNIVTPSEVRLTEAKVLNEVITAKLEKQ